MVGLTLNGDVDGATGNAVEFITGDTTGDPELVGTSTILKSTNILSMLSETVTSTTDIVFGSLPSLSSTSENPGLFVSFKE